MAYRLVFDFDGRKFEFTTPSLKEEDLQNAVKLKGSNKKAFIISKAEKKGRMFWGVMKQTDFDIIKIKGG